MPECMSGRTCLGVERDHLRKGQCSGSVTSPLEAGGMSRGVTPLFPSWAIRLLLTSVTSSFRESPGWAQ